MLCTHLEYNCCLHTDLHSGWIPNQLKWLTWPRLIGAAARVMKNAYVINSEHEGHLYSPLCGFADAQWGDSEWWDSTTNTGVKLFPIHSIPDTDWIRHWLANGIAFLYNIALIKKWIAPSFDLLTSQLWPSRCSPWQNEAADASLVSSVTPGGQLCRPMGDREGAMLM